MMYTLDIHALWSVKAIKFASGKVLSELSGQPESEAFQQHVERWDPGRNWIHFDHFMQNLTNFMIAPHMSIINTHTVSSVLQWSQ